MVDTGLYKKRNKINTLRSSKGQQNSLVDLNSYTVGENIIATTKIRNNYGAIQSLIFLYCSL